VSQTKKTTIALFNYGGGMRGLIPAYIMMRIEEITGLRMADMVDVFAGPSTGAILNAALTMRHPDNPERPKYRARHLVRFYEREGINIFPEDRFRELRGIVHDFNNRTLKLSQLDNLFRHGHYDPANLGKALRALFGHANLSDSLRSLIVPVYNIDRAPVVIESIDKRNGRPAVKNRFLDEGGHAVWLKNIRTGTPEEFAARTPGVSLYDAVIASCAAPTYYPCHHFPVDYPDARGRTMLSGIDGVIFDNPCISYLGALREHVPADHRLTMLILGTGYTNKPVKKEDWNRYGALGIVDPVNDLPLINIFFHASESALMESFGREMGENIHIFNKSLLTDLGKPGHPSLEIDDASPENLKALQRFAEIIMEERKQQLDEICHLLVCNRDRRMGEKENHPAKQGFGQSIRRYVNMFARKTGT
jgi:uncharacterized protein